MRREEERLDVPAFRNFFLDPEFSVAGPSVLTARNLAGDAFGNLDLATEQLPREPLLAPVVGQPIQRREQEDRNLDQDRRNDDGAHDLDDVERWRQARPPADVMPINGMKPKHVRGKNKSTQLVVLPVHIIFVSF